MAECEILTQDVLRQLLDYDPEAGHFYWRPRDESVPKNRWWNSRLAGARAGALKKSTGYIIVTVFNRGYSAHRLAFLWMTGAWPSDHVDHVNGIRDDNRWSNLRNATRQENVWNTPAYGKTGKKGVSWHRKDKKFQALIKVDGRSKYLGSFDTSDEAEAAYNAEAGRMRGEFAYHMSGSHGRSR